MKHTKKALAALLLSLVLVLGLMPGMSLTAYADGHTHNFEYSANGDTITATCTASGCNLTDSKVTLTIKAPENLYYDDTTASHAATLENLDAFNAATGKGFTQDNITYYKGSTQNQDIKKGTPKGATYTAKIAADGNLFGNNVASVTFTFTAKPVVHTHSFNYTSNGAVITATCTSTTGTCDLTSKQATLTLNAPEHVMYDDGKSAEATFTGSIPGVTNPTIHYSKGDATLGSAPTEAGTYTAWCQLGNATARVEYNINKKTNPGFTTLPQAKQNLVYTGSAQELITAGATSTGDIRYGLGTADSDANANYTGAVPSAVNSGTYYVWCKIDGGKNYTSTAAQKVEVRIAKANITPSVSIVGWTYGETAKNPMVSDTANPGNGDVTYTYKVKDADDSTYSATVPTDAGDYTVKAAIAETTNYKGGEATADFTIGKAALTVTAKDQTICVGDEVPDLSTPVQDKHYTVTGLAGEGALPNTPTLAYQKNGEAATPVNTTTGTYDIVPSGASASENYTISYANGMLTINRANATLTAPTAKNLTFTGEAQELVEAGSTSDGDLLYSADGENYSTEIPKGTEAKTYTVWYKVVGNANHNDTAAARIDVTIRSADTTPTNPSADTLTYTGEAQALVTGGSVAGGELQYALGSDADAAPALERFTATVPTGTDAGTYYVWYRIKGDANHNDVAPVCIVVSIAKAAITPTVSITGWTYGETANAPSVTGNTGNGKVSYTYSDAADGTFTATVPSNAGTYYVKATVAESDNYLGATTQSLSFAIAKANVNVSAEAKSKTYGDADPELTYTVTGLVGSDKLTGALTRANGENVGAYAIQQGTLAAGDNYMLTFSGANLTIGKKAITVTADAKSKVEGESDPELTYTVTGLVGSDKLTGALARDTGDAPGDYAITQGTLTASDNYTLTFKGAKLTITAKPVAPTDTPTRRPVVPDYTLLATMKASGKTAMKLSWTKVAEADGYDIFFKKCDGKSDYPLVASVKGRDTLGYEITGLKKSTSYKAYVKAWKMVNGAKTYIGKASPTLHAITGNYTRSKTNAKKVTVKASKVTLAIGKTSTIKASVKGVKSGRSVLSHSKKLRYYSSDRNVATVTSAGKIKATGTGSCTIYVIANNGVRASVKVTVVDGLTKIAFKKSSYSVKKGKTLKLASKITLTPSGVTTAYTWTSSNPSIATVSAKGVVKGIKKGTVTITVTSANVKTATTKVKVN